MYGWLFDQFPIDIAFDIIFKTKDLPLIRKIIQETLKVANKTQKEKIESRWNDTTFWYSKLKSKKGDTLREHLLYDPQRKLPREIKERECKTWRDKFLNYLCYGSWEDISETIKKTINVYKASVESDSYCKLKLEDDRIYMYFSDRTFGFEFVHAENTSDRFENTVIWGLPESQKDYINQSKFYFQISEISSLKAYSSEKTFLDQFRELIFLLEVKFPVNSFSIKYHRYTRYGLWIMIVEITILYPLN